MNHDHGHAPPGPESPSPAPATSIASPPGRHSFVLVGRSSTYAIHIPMFGMEPHRFQLVMRLRLPADVERRLRAAQRAEPDVPFIIGNEPIDLMTLPNIAAGHKREMRASIWRGIPKKDLYTYWPWRDERPFYEDFIARIESVTYFRHFDFGLGRPELETYVLFGRRGEAFLHHLSIARPDYDEVAVLAEAPDWLPADVLEAGVTVAVEGLSTGGVVRSSPLADTLSVRYGGMLPSRTLRVHSRPWFDIVILNGGDPYPPTGASSTP